MKFFYPPQLYCVTTLPSKTNTVQVDTAAGWSASAHRPDHDGLSGKKSTSTSLNLTCGLQITLILIPWITIFGVLFSNESTTNDSSRRWKNWSERVTEWQKLSQRFIDNSINEWHRRLEAVIKSGGGHIEHCNLAWAAAHHFNTIDR